MDRFAHEADLPDGSTRHRRAGLARTGLRTRAIAADVGIDLAAMLAEQPDLFAVTRELDLRALRDPEVRAVIADRERGWRASLTPLLEQAAPDGVDPATATELVVNVIKGASLNPASATAVLEQLALLLICD